MARRILAVDVITIAAEREDGDPGVFGIDDPILRDASVCVLAALRLQIVIAVGFAKHLDHQRGMSVNSS